MIHRRGDEYVASVACFLIPD